MSRFIKVKKISKIGKMFFVILLIQSCDIFNNDYENLIQATKELKIKEELGSSNALEFDGYQEPRFPSQVDIDKDLRGIDVNNDGVRDDVEIWINRNAESQEIRKSFKDYYKKSILMFEAVKNNSPAELVKDAVELSIVSGVCLIKSGAPYNEKYLKDFQKETGAIYSKRFEVFFLNTNYRKKINEKLEKLVLGGAIGRSNDFINKYCEEIIGIQSYAKLKGFSKKSLNR